MWTLRRWAGTALESQASTIDAISVSRCAGSTELLDIQTSLSLRFEGIFKQLLTMLESLRAAAGVVADMSDTN